MTGQRRQARPVDRHPLAFGMIKWGPLPDSSSWLLWDGPGSGLYYHAQDPETSPLPGQRIRHPSASGSYDTLRAAEAAVFAFVAAYHAAAAEEQQR